MDLFFSIAKDAMLCILIAITLDKIQKGGDEKWFRLVFLAILLVL